MLRTMLLATLLAQVVPKASALADENMCTTGGRGQDCRSGADCEARGFASVCVADTCQIPCASDTGERAPGMCSLGETCVQGESDRGDIYYCQATAFRMDLNLLDMCVAHFVHGIMPDLANSSTCSLQRNLAQMLDQDDNGVFNVYDVDACIRAFFYNPVCDPEAKTCPTGEIYCEQDEDCGDGLYCSLEAHLCQRDCGFIANRETSGADLLERPCYGRLKTCNFDHGNCVDVALDGQSCQVDGDCPEGAYCFLGSCAPMCYRAIDCPQADWYCTPTNKCAPIPRAADDGSEPFDPLAYTVLFAQKRVELTEINDSFQIPLVIMDLRSRSEVFSDPRVAFGYRLEMTYGRKNTPACLDILSKQDATKEEVEGCLVSGDEEFLTLQSPFGTVSAASSPTIDIQLNHAAVAMLDPGVYRATIRAMYTNGTGDSTTVEFRKHSLSGEYSGQLSIYYDDPDKNHLGNTTLEMRLLVEQDERKVITWQQFMESQNLAAEADYEDVTEGFPVTGLMYGNTSVVFNQPSAVAASDNLIPIKGIYSSSLRRMRLMAVIDIPEGHCRSDAGGCGLGDAYELSVHNTFGRKIRRLIQFIGPFDAKSRRFHGMYRETVTGLAPFSVTFDGGFRLDQATPLSGGLAGDSFYNPPLVSADDAAPTPFPTTESILDIVNWQVAANCSADNASMGRFATQEERVAYAQGFEQARQHFADPLPGNGVPPFGEFMTSLDEQGSVFEDLTSFSAQIQGALSALQGRDTSDELSIHEFLQGKIFLCSEKNETNCIDERMAHCGLALFRKAMLEGWASMGQLGAPIPSGDELFCDVGSQLEGCQVLASQRPNLKALQEHNRFYSALTHALQYQAASELSEAFFTLYRQAGTGIGQSQALSLKHQHLLAAWDRYEDLRDLMFSEASTKVLFDWPMEGFKMRGGQWLTQMHSVLSDRLDALREIVDLKRRVFVTADAQDYAFVQHLLHMEYLTQAFMLALQRQWQGPNFAYQGQGPQILSAGTQILAQLNSTRNPLGFHANQVFFENSGLGRSNWQNYLAQIRGEVFGGGLLGGVNKAIQTAITELKASLRDEQTLQAELLASRQGYEQRIDQICGPQEPPEAEEGCYGTSPQERQQALTCVGAGCQFEFRCENEECTDVVQQFGRSTGSSLEQIACRVDTPDYAIQLGSRPRPCVRGQVGALLQEKALLDLQRRHVYRKLKNLTDRVDRAAREIGTSRDKNQELVESIKNTFWHMELVDKGLTAANLAYEVGTAPSRALDCWVIVGMATGTNCPTHALSSGLMTAARVAHIAVSEALKTTRNYLQRNKEIRQIRHGNGEGIRRQEQHLDDLISTVDTLVSEYELIVQQLFNLRMRVNDSLYLAEQAANHYQQNVGQIADHLLGNAQGNVLRRNTAVAEANAKFLEMLRLTYKMASAFVHSYNLKGQSEAILNEVFGIVTADGVDDFIESLEGFENSYCGSAGIDCDAPNNISTLRFSLRDELFPRLMDREDTKTGTVLTKGQQFHNIITSSAFRKTRVRGPLTVEQLEIPFAIWLGEGGGARKWMVSPLECNHIIAGRGNGSIAVNVHGTRLHNLKYEFIRGNTDFIRGCELQNITPAGGDLPVLEYPVNSFIVGYAPQHVLAKEDEAPQFVTRSGGQPACRNRPESSQGILEDESCYRYFARDRSLGATDWKIVVPIDLEGNNWVLGDGLPAKKRPVIEDIVLHIRYRSRPTTE